MCPCTCMAFTSLSCPSSRCTVEYRFFLSHYHQRNVPFKTHADTYIKMNLPFQSFMKPFKHRIHICFSFGTMFMKICRLYFCHQTNLILCAWSLFMVCQNYSKKHVDWYANFWKNKMILKWQDDKKIVESSTVLCLNILSVYIDAKKSRGKIACAKY